MGFLAAIKRAAVSFLVVFNWTYALLSRRYKIHRARFARVDELARLMAESLDRDPNLILGVSHLNHILRVKPLKTRRELGNLSIGVQMLTGIGVQMLTTPQVEEVAACPGNT